MKLDDNGILNLDFFLSMITILILILYSFYFIEERLNLLNEEKEDMAIRSLVDKISLKINKAQIIGESINGSYSTPLYLPPKINNKTYKITVNDKELILETSDKKGYGSLISLKIAHNTQGYILNSGEKYIIHVQKEDNLSYMSIYRVI